MTVRVMTFNIWGDYFGNPVEEREGQIGAVIARHAPDILGVQEITQNWHSSALFCTLSETYEISGGEGFHENNYVPLLWRRDMFTALACGFVPFPDTPDISKGISWAVLRHRESQKTICAMNTHFWWKYFGEAENDAIRVSNAARLTETAEQLSRTYGAPAVAFGDLNSTLSMPTIPYLLSHGWNLARDGAPLTSEVGSHHGDPVRGADGRYHGTKTEKRYPASIDHILYRGAIRPVEFSVIEEQDALDASDHSPLLCTFTCED